jgi:hypothetical protein
MTAFADDDVVCTEKYRAARRASSLTYYEQW